MRKTATILGVTFLVAILAIVCVGAQPAAAHVASRQPTHTVKKIQQVKHLKRVQPLVVIKRPHAQSQSMLYPLRTILARFRGTAIFRSDDHGLAVSAQLAKVLTTSQIDAAHGVQQVSLVVVDSSGRSLSLTPWATTPGMTPVVDCSVMNLHSVTGNPDLHPCAGAVAHLDTATGRVRFSIPAPTLRAEGLRGALTVSVVADWGSWDGTRRSVVSVAATIGSQSNPA